MTYHVFSGTLNPTHSLTHSLWKSVIMALKKPGKIGKFFLLLCGHPDKFYSEVTAHVKYTV